MLFQLKLRSFITYRYIIFFCQENICILNRLPQGAREMLLSWLARLSKQVNLHVFTSGTTCKA